MNRTLFIFSFLLLIFCWTSCTKKADVATTTVSTSDTFYSFINDNNVALKVDLYNTKSDYINGTNIVLSCTVPANGYYAFSSKKLDSTATYYYDFYTMDYSFSNWGYYGTSSSPSFTINNNIRALHLNGGFTQSLTRLVYLSGNQSSTTWNAIDYLDYSGISQWTYLQPYQRYKQLVFRKSLTGMWYQKDASSNIVGDSVTNMEYYSSGSSTSLSSFQLYISNLSSYYRTYNVNNPQGINSGVAVATLDTILVYDGSYYWEMKKQ